ncbi:MAG: hypothetical protein IPN17_07100 [Deltaproteobacteria bacterium]|nr:hypothetical protein [Deltaproteobacteria bacterium]
MLSSKGDSPRAAEAVFASSSQRWSIAALRWVMMLATVAITTSRVARRWVLQAT